VEVVVAALAAGAAGLLIGFVVSFVIARRWRVSRIRLAAETVDALHIAALVVDRSATVLIANPVAKAMGLVRGDQLALPELRTLAAQAARTGRAEQAEVRLLHGWLPREPLAVVGRAVPIAAGGYVAVVVEDVTEARRVADVRRDFVANVSHELKTPVGAIALLTEALQEAQDDRAAVLRFSERLRHESDRLGRLAQGLIDLSRLEAARPLEVVPVPLTRVVAEAVDRTSTAASARQITVVTTGDLQVIVSGVHDQLVTALVNLIENAIQYSPPDTLVTVSVREVSGDEPCVEIAVIDEGVGIAEPDLERVFERFYRADPARAGSTGGTGLGLAIVKHVAVNHGGRVDVSSTLGRGSRFTLTLPAAPAERLMAAPA
jgi:two-component system sensor histidine kinase SenX3